ncbi:MAG TPA: aspartate kinase [Halanaerobiales bacterium]|nr:aspartate kinase [Halanaerobiales bacterium]
MLTVEKIGGSSMSEFQSVLNNIIGQPDSERFSYNRVFVVSAYAGVTDLLLEDKKNSEPGIYQSFINDDGTYKAKLDELNYRLTDINKKFADLGLDVKEADRFIKKRIEHTKKYLDSMEEILSSGYIKEANIYSAAREILTSLGEAHSAYNSHIILSNLGINSQFVDLTGFYDRTQLTMEERIKKSFDDIDLFENIVIAPGYTKDKGGMITQFGRGYSEITFSRIATFLNADQAIIHKEHHLSSADPEIVGKEKAIPVGRTNYNVADQLADIGMEAIHPKASKPLELAGIKLIVKNTFEPEHPGTIITKDFVVEDSKIEIIAGSKEMVVIEVHDTSMVGEVGFDYEIMQILKKHNISYVMKATNANSISQVIWEKDLSEDLVNELKDKYTDIKIKEIAMVCLIGSNISKPNILARAAQVLGENGININCVSISLSQVNIQFVVNRENYIESIKLLNDNLMFEK